MKLTPASFSPLCLSAFLALCASPALRAQDSTTTTTTTVTVQPTPMVDPTQTTTVTTVQTTPLPGQHVAEIELAVSHGSVQAYFGRASRDGKFEIGDVKLDIKLPRFCLTDREGGKGSVGSWRA